MSKNKPAFWIIRNNRFGSTLGVDGKWYNMTSVENIKTYKTEGGMTRRLRRISPTCDCTAFAVYPGETLDCCGRILNEQGVSAR